MTHELTVEDVVALALAVIDSRAEPEVLAQIQPLHMRLLVHGETEKNRFFSKVVPAIELQGPNEVHLVIDDGEPSVGVEVGYFVNPVKQRSLRWYITHVVMCPESDFDSDVEFVEHRQRTLGPFAQQLSDLLPEGHAQKREYRVRFV